MYVCPKWTVRFFAMHLNCECPATDSFTCCCCGCLTCICYLFVSRIFLYRFFFLLSYISTCYFRSIKLSNLFVAILQLEHIHDDDLMTNYYRITFGFFTIQNYLCMSLFFFIRCWMFALAIVKHVQWSIHTHVSSTMATRLRYNGYFCETFKFLFWADFDGYFFRQEKKNSTVLQFFFMFFILEFYFCCSSLQIHARHT